MQLKIYLITKNNALYRSTLQSMKIALLPFKKARMKSKSQ